MRTWIVLFIIGMASSLAGLAQASLYVSSEKTHQVLRYHGSTGQFIDAFAEGGGLDYPEGLSFGPEGDLYVASYFSNQILRYDGETGAFKEVFVDAGVGDLECPVGIGFRGDLLYVSNRCTESVIRFRAGTGEFVDVFATGGLQFADWFVWGPDGDMFISSRVNDTVKRFDGETGADKGTFISGVPLDFPQGLAFGADGRLYVVSSESDQILRFNGDTGAFIDVFATHSRGFGIAFHHSGDVLAGNILTHSINRFDGETGESLGVFAEPKSGGLTTPTFMVTRTICGDQLVEDDEECDDGNVVDGDGCSASCETEEASVGSGPGSGGSGPVGAGGAGGSGVDLGDEFDIYGRGCSCRVGPGGQRERGGLALLGLLLGLVIVRKQRPGAA